MSTGDAHGLAGVARRMRGVRWDVLSLVGLAVAVLTWLVALPALADGPGAGSMLANHGWHAWVIVWLLAVSTATRTVGLRDVVGMWLVGTFTVMTLVSLVAVPVVDRFGQGAAVVEWYVPLVEEGAKALVLLGWAAVRWRDDAAQHGVLDLLLLGFVVGGGFGVHEDALFGRQVASGTGPGGLSLLFPTFLAGGQYAIAHAGWGALVGVGVGLASLLRHQRVLAVGALASFLLLAVVDHGAVNAGTGTWRSTWTGDGRTTGLLLLGCVVVAVVAEVVLLHRDGLLGLPLGPRTLRDAVRNGDGVVDRAVRLLAASRYRRARVAASWAHLRGTARPEAVGRRLATWSALAVAPPAEAPDPHTVVDAGAAADDPGT